MLFEHFNISAASFLGVVMDFSPAQRKGFLEAYETFFAKHGHVPEDGRKCIKGCYMHWMQSVQRIVSNYAVVPQDSQNIFVKLLVTLRTTSSEKNSIRQFLNWQLSFQIVKDG